MWCVQLSRTIFPYVMQCKTPQLSCKMLVRTANSAKVGGGGGGLSQKERRSQKIFGRALPLPLNAPQ